MQLAHIDADQDLDLVVVHYQNGVEDVVVYLGDGNGAFTALPGHETGAGGQAVEVGDLDSNGTMDIVVANSASNTISVLLGNGDGTFAEPVSYAAGAGPASLVVDDLSGDGVDDVLVGNLDGASLGMFENSGTGALYGQVELPLVAFPHELHSADLDGDGRSELVVLSDADSPDPYGFIQTFTFHWTTDDDFAPNHDCASAALLGPGLYEDLILVDDHPSDLYAVDVPAGWSVVAQVEHLAGSGSVATYLYDQASFGQGCGLGSGYVDADLESSPAQEVSAVNQGADVNTFFVQVEQTESPVGDECNRYRLRLILEAQEGVRSLCSGAAPFADCPCGNQSAHPLDGCANATGQGARIRVSGSISVQQDDAVMHLTQARPGQPALLIQGWSETRQPFRDGVLCAGNPTRRLESLILDPFGSGHTVQSIVQTGTVPGPGVKRIYQFWYRDPLISPCGTGSNFSAAMELTWQ